MGIACRCNSTDTQATTNEFGAHLMSAAEYMLTLPIGTSIREGWTVQVSGVAYTVTAVARGGTWGSAVRALIVRTEPIGG